MYIIHGTVLSVQNSICVLLEIMQVFVVQFLGALISNTSRVIVFAEWTTSYLTTVVGLSQFMVKQFVYCCCICCSVCRHYVFSRNACLCALMQLLSSTSFVLVSLRVERTAIDSVGASALVQHGGIMWTLSKHP